MEDNLEPTDTIIKLIVTNGAANTEALNIHRGVLCKSSGFFQRAMKPAWIESRERPDIIDLPDDSVQTVSGYIRWLYSGHMPIKLHEPSRETRDRDVEEANKVFDILAEAYVFGEKIIDVKYKNAVVKTMLAAVHSSRQYPGHNSVNIIYKGTPSASPLRRFIADSVAFAAYDDLIQGGNGWMAFFDACPREALVDAIKAIVRVRPSPEHSIDPCTDLYVEEEDEERLPT